MKRFLAGAVAVLCIVVGAVLGSPANPSMAVGPACTISETPQDPMYRFVAVPGDVASKQSPIELRLGLNNTSGSSKTWSVTFYVDSITPSLKINNPAISVTVPAGERGLASVMWDPIYFTGDHTLIWEATVGGVTTSNAADPWPIKILDITTSAPEYFGAAWVEPGAIMRDPAVSQSTTAGPAYVADRVDEMHDLGIDTIIIAYSEFIGGDVNKGPFYNSSLEYLYPEDPDDTPAFDIVGTILHQACLNDMHVIVGLGRGLDPWLDVDAQPSNADMDDRAEYELELANDLYNKYGVNDYYGANKGTFYGWYQAYEPNDYVGSQRFFDTVAEGLHESFGPEKVVLVAPGGTPLGMTTAVLNSSKSDIFAYQEAAGPGYIGPGASCLPSCPINPSGTATSGYAYTFEPYNRIADLSSIFASYAAEHSGTNKHIWADTEAWEMDGTSLKPGHYGDPYAAKCERVADQIVPEADHVSMLTVYDFFGPFRGPTNSNTLIPYTDSDQMYDGYEAYYNAGLPGLTGSTALCP